MNSLFIPSGSKFSKRGGPKTFLSNLLFYLDENDFNYTNKKYKILGAKGIFFPIFYSERILKYFRINKKPIIQRLDGVYYFSQHGDSARSLNLPIQNVYENYSTHLVFQSEYSKKMVESEFGKSNKPSRIIVNGVNLKNFFPNYKKEIGSTVKIVTSAYFRNKDQIVPIIEALDVINIKFELFVIGKVEKHLEEYFKRDYIKFLGEISNDNIPEILRSCDFYLFSFLNPPCPNSVIEAISCGLPVVSFGSGSMSELCYFNQELLADVTSSEIFHKKTDFDPRLLKEKIFFLLENYNLYRKKSLDHCQSYSLEKMGACYLSFFQEILNEN